MPEAIESTLRAVEPAVRLVAERHLRKALHYLRDHGRCVPINPELPVWTTRQELTAIDILPHAVFSGNEDPLLLVTTPNDRVLESLPRDRQLREYWRLLYRAAIEEALDKLTADACEERLARFGPATAREIGYVLEADHLVDPEADGQVRYAAFAGAYLDLHAFSPSDATDFFPSLPPAEEVLVVLGQDVDVSGLLARTRPEGAAETMLAETHPHAREPWRATGSGGNLTHAAEAEKKGNLVRAAILHTQSGSNGAGSAIYRLVDSLAATLLWHESTRDVWRDALHQLLVPAASGDWPRAARCLYELQKIPADLSREIFAVDLVEPIRTLGRRPVKRPLPHARPVMMLLRLRAAHKQLIKSGLDEEVQDALDDLFHHEMHRLETGIRQELTPIVRAALDDSGLKPASRVEEVARDKLVAELLDRVCERGYLRFGDLRDAIARNQLKMPDLTGPVQFLAGDALLRADTRLAYELDGIYRRGEFYLRSLQRSSSLFFGTVWGRRIFLYLIAPFLAAFLTLTFAIELKHIGGKIYAFTSKILAPKKVLSSSLPAATADGAPILLDWNDRDELEYVELPEYVWDENHQLVWVDHEPEIDWDDDGRLISFDPDEFVEVTKAVVTSSASKAAAPGEEHESPLPTWEPVFVLGILLLLLFHAPPVRRAFFSVVGGLLGVLRSLLWDLPAAALRSQVVVAIRYSTAMRILSRHLSGAILVTAAFVFFLWFLGAPPARLVRWGGVVFILATIAFNTPWGRAGQEDVAERISDGWRIVRVNLLPGLLAAFVDWFRRLANWVERQLYAVDEWLRFRGGDSQGSLVMKALIGLFWFPFAYLSRFAFYLLIEPQINPVKHFPVVTVSHKVILPLAGQVAESLNVTLTTAGLLLAGIPGIFGFIAWELLSNWKLYAANRPGRLKPVMIGSHGETMRGLLRPGFHSGTVPKLYRKLRRADHRGDRTKAARWQHELQHVGEGLTRFVDRELIALLAGSAEMPTLRISLADIEFGCQRLIVSLAAEGMAGSLSISFENRGGRVAAAIEDRGWFDSLPEVQRLALQAALRGFLDMAAVEVCQERDRCPEGVELDQTYGWDDWVKRWESARA